MSIRLTFTAVLLALKVRKIRHTALNQLIIELANTPGLPRHSQIGDALVATNLACRVVGRLGLLNTCLTKSLVMGTLIADHQNVMMHIGFKASEPSKADGHAWLTHNGRLIPFFAGETEEVLGYQMTQSFPLHR